MKKDVEDYLQEGIYGKKDLNAYERKKFLGTLRERIVLALTKGEVMKGKGLKQLEKTLQQNKSSRILLNGNVSFRFFKKYKTIASTHNIPYKSVNNREAQSEFGLIVTYDHAIDKEDIYLQENTTKEKTKKKKSFFQSLFKLY